MHNWPNITSLEVAIVCTAALVLCILPNFVTLADGRRRRRQVRDAAEQMAMQRRAAEAAQQAAADSLLVPAPVESVAGALFVASEEVMIDVAQTSEDQVSAAPTEEPVALQLQPEPTELVAPIAPAPEPAVAVVAESLPATPTATSEPTPYQLRLDELRRVKLPNWPPAEVRDNPERKRMWDEGLRVADQPAVTSLQLNSPRAAESACLAAAESAGSLLRLRFLLFRDLWPVAADQATAEATFEIDSATGSVSTSVRSL